MAGGYLRRSAVLTMKTNDSSQLTVRGRQQQPKKTWQWTVDFRLWAFLVFWVCAVSGAQPAPPTGLSVAASYDGEVNLIWTPDTSSSPATAYLISRQQIADLTNTPTPNLTATPTPVATVLLTSMPGAGTPVYQDFQVTNGQNYFYQVWGQNSGGDGTPSAVIARPFLAPVAVQPLTVQNIHSNALDLSWGVPNSSYPVSYYKVSLYEAPAYTPTFTPTGTWTPAAITPTPVFPQTPVLASVVASMTPIATVLSPGYIDTTSNSANSAGFYYVVVGVDNLGHVGALPTYASNPALPHNMAPPGPPALSVLVSLSVTPTIVPSGYGARLIWNSSLGSEGVTGYKVLQNGTPIATIAYQTATPTMTYDDTTLPEGNSFSAPVTYSVQAINTYGTSTSNSVNVSIVAANEQTNIQVVPNATTNAVSVSWDPAQPGTYGVGSYRVYKGLSGIPVAFPSPIPSGSPTATPTPTSFAAVTIIPGATPTLVVVDAPIQNHVSYWVEPVDLTGHGGVVNGASTPTLNLAPTPPSNVGVANPVGNNQIAVSWTAGSAGFFGTPQAYVIYRLMLTNPTPTPLAIATVAFNPSLAQQSYTDSVSGSAGTGVGYQVGLEDSAGNISDIASFGNSVNLIGLTTPAAPTVLPLSGSPGAIEFSWLGNPLADSVTAYSVVPSSLLTSPVTVIAAAQTPAPQLVYAPAAPATWAANYYYLVAQNTQGSSNPATLSGIAVPTYTVTAVISPGTRQAQVSWNMAPVPPVAGTLTPGIDSYGIYRSLSPSANLTPVATVPLGTNNYSDTLPSSPAGVTYYYHVTARAGGGVSQLAESPLFQNPDSYASVMAWPNAPAAFSALSLVNQTTLYWAGNNPQEGVTGYSVFLDATPIATVLASPNPTPTYAVTITEVAGAQSSYYVVANNVAGPSDSSQTVSILVPPAMTPTIGLTPPPFVTPTSTIAPGVWISGLTSSGAVSNYSIYRQSEPTPSGPGTPVAAPTYFIVGVMPLGTSTPVFEDLTPVPGYVNKYRVVADNGAGVTAVPTISAPLTVALWPAAPVPTLVPNANSVTVSWDSPVGDAPVTSYDVYRSVYPTLTPSPIATNLAYPTTTYPDSPVSTGIPYIYWIDAQNASGGSALSAPSTIVPITAPTICITPLPERNQLVWAPISVPTTSPVTGYAVFRAAVTLGVPPNFAQVGSIVEPLSNTTVVDSSGVSDGVTYIYEIAPATSNGILGAFSNQVGVTVAPQPVANLIAVSGDGLVQLRWNYQGVATNSFFITRQLGTALISSPQTIKANFQGVNYTDTGVVDKNFYVYTVYTVDANGNTATSSASVTALPAKPPAVANTTVTVAQNSSNAQTLIGNTLTWQAADFTPPNQLNFDPTTMYPLGGYVLYRSKDGGAVYDFTDFPPVILPVTLMGGVPSNPVSYFDEVPLVGGKTYTYLVQAFDHPPDLPVPLSQAVTEGWVHETTYQPVNAYPISPNTALDRNAIRPFGASNERVVNIRFIVPSPGNVDIKVYTLNGTFVEELVNQYYSQAGIYWTKWDAHNRFGSMVASGVYLITTESPGGHQEFEKVAVIK